MKRIVLCVFVVLFSLAGCAPNIPTDPNIRTETPADAGAALKSSDTPAPAGTSTPKPIGWGSLNEQVAQLDIDNAGPADVIRIFGEPAKYTWNRENYTEDALPPQYLMDYSNGFSVFIWNDSVIELRFSGMPLYVYDDMITIGMTIDEVFAALGEPDEIVENVEPAYVPGVFYKDKSGQRGSHYYEPAGHPLRLFFMGDRVQSLYLTRSNYADAIETEKRETRTTVSEVNPYDDIRRLDISGVDFTGQDDLIKTLWFSQDTEWPASALALTDGNPERVLEATMNPGLGVRALHDRGITGEGIRVAIIDQPTYTDHPEFAGKIVAYRDFDSGQKESMHGPAVASLLVGENTGTAPGAGLYFAAAPSWFGDAGYYADALDWIVEENNKLPEGDKIRVVSVSAAPSGPGSPFTKNNEMWDEAVARAEQDGILVLDCTSHHGFINSCYYDLDDPDDISKCRAGYPGMDRTFPAGENEIFAPTSPRTSAQEEVEGIYGYQYTGRGGLSWAIPYCAGVLAMGWQVRPELSGEEMKAILLDTAYDRDGYKFIDPAAFIAAVEKYGE